MANSTTGINSTSSSRRRSVVAQHPPRRAGAGPRRCGDGYPPGPPAPPGHPGNGPGPPAPGPLPADGTGRRRPGIRMITGPPPPCPGAGRCPREGPVEGVDCGDEPDGGLGAGPCGPAGDREGVVGGRPPGAGHDARPGVDEVGVAGLVGGAAPGGVGGTGGGLAPGGAGIISPHVLQNVTPSATRAPHSGHFVTANQSPLPRAQEPPPTGGLSATLGQAAPLRPSTGIGAPRGSPLATIGPCRHRRPEPRRGHRYGNETRRHGSSFGAHMRSRSTAAPGGATWHRGRPRRSQKRVKIPPGSRGHPCGHETPRHRHAFHAHIRAHCPPGERGGPLGRATRGPGTGSAHGISARDQRTGSAHGLSARAPRPAPGSARAPDP